jgi:hypothetical protein
MAFRHQAIAASKRDQGSARAEREIMLCSGGIGSPQLLIVPGGAAFSPPPGPLSLARNSIQKNCGGEPGVTINFSLSQGGALKDDP